ncbi:MAG: hypothetical protein ABIG11_09685, partial [bacterium]
MRKNFPLPYRKITLLTLCIVAGYVLARHFIYRAMPAHDPDAWFRRDLVMSIPRLAALALCILVTIRCGGWKRWGWG